MSREIVTDFTTVDSSKDPHFVQAVTVFVTDEFLKLLLGGHVARLHDTGVLSRDQANDWWSSLADADADGTFLYGFTAFIVSGTKA